MLKYLIAPLGICATTATAQDDCLTGRDLSRGVQMVYAEGDVATVTRGRNGRLELLETYSDGSNPVLFTGAYALYMESEIELENGRPVDNTLLTVDFGKPSTQLPEPTAGGGFELQTKNIFADGFERTENYTAQFGDAAQMEISGCVYDVIPVTLRYAWPEENDGLTVEYSYFPQIGAGFLAASQFDGDDRLTVTPIRLERRQK